MDPVILFLKDETLPEDRTKAKKTRRKAPQSWLSKEQKLYERWYQGPYLLCIHPKAVDALLEKLHEGTLSVTLGEGLYCTRLLLKGTGGLACRSLPRSLPKNAISAKGMP